MNRIFFWNLRSLNPPILVVDRFMTQSGTSNNTSYLSTFIRHNSMPTESKYVMWFRKTTDDWLRHIAIWPITSNKLLEWLILKTNDEDPAATSCPKLQYFYSYWIYTTKASNWNNKYSLCWYIFKSRLLSERLGIWRVKNFLSLKRYTYTSKPLETER